MTKATAKLATVMVEMMREGANPGQVAEWLTRQMGKPGYVALCHLIEGAASPGTFAEAVFNMIAD